MESTNVYKFPDKLSVAAKPVAKVAPPVKSLPVESAAKSGVPTAKPGVRVFHTFLMVIVILNRPLGWMFGAVFGWYFLRWVFMSGAAGTFAGFVALASFVGIVALKYLVMSWKDESSRNTRPTKKAK